jgi:hypothetical protein
MASILKTLDRECSADHRRIARPPNRGDHSAGSGLAWCGSGRPAPPATDAVAKVGKVDILVNEL